jgi:carbon monoxide dehydrogenase subunit G
VLIEDSFTVATPVDHLWRVLQDVERIAPCLPGAELTETVDERTWKGKVHVKFGPVQLSFAGTVVVDERDDPAHRARLTAKGTEQRGKGAATAKVESWLEPSGEGTTAVHIRSDITITGAAAQLSRGLLPEVTKLLTKEFADCLESMVTAPANEATSTDTPTASSSATPKAVGGLRLALRALWARIKRFLARLFRPRSRS